MRVIVASSDGRSLIIFRGEFVKKMVQKGHEVFCISCEDDEETKASIEALGAKYVCVPMSRTGTNVFEDMKTIRCFKKVIREIKPDMYFASMSKPVCYGGTAARACKVKHINVVINGLEIAFYTKGLKSAIIRLVLKLFYGHVNRGCDNVFFENSDDRDTFRRLRVVSEKNAVVVNGAGVDMERFKKSPVPDDPVALLVARLVWSKGIGEYLEAAKIVKEKMPNARFMLVGGLDNNQESLTKEELDKYVDEGIVEYKGFANDVRPYLNECSLFVLPTYHEGTPVSVLEAMSCGRAIIISDAPGCHGVVVDGYNGYFVEVKNSEQLAEKILAVFSDDKLRKEMGENSYQICKEKYEINLVLDFMMDKMGL